MRKIIAFIFALISLNSLSQPLKLYAENIKGANYLIWKAKKWDPQIQSFLLKRRLYDESKWEVISSEIQISTEKNKAIENSINGSEKTKIIFQKRYKEYIETDSLKSFTSNQLISYLNSNMIGAFNSLINLNFNYAIFLGFGFIDENANDLEYEYALYANTNHGEIFLDKCRPLTPKEKLPLNLIDSTFLSKHNFHFNISLYGDLQFGNFYNYYLIEDDSIEIHIPLLKSIKSDTSLYLNGFVSKTKISNDPNFKLIIKSYFDKEVFSKKITIDKGLLNILKLKETQLKTGYIDPQNKRDGGIEIKWNIDDSYNEQIRNFNLVCVHSNSGDTLLNQTMPKESRIFQQVNTATMTYGEYEYFLTVNYQYDIPPLISRTKFRHTPPIEPDRNVQPQNFKVSVTENKTVLLSWNPSQSDNVIGYKIAMAYFEGDGIAVNNDIPIQNTTQYEFIPYNNISDKMKFAIVPVLTDGKYGDRTEVAEVITPSRKIYSMRLYEFDVIKNTNKTASITWSYNQEVNDLEKYEILHNNEVIANLDKELYSWNSNPLQSGKHTFQVRAVTMYGLMSDPSYPRSIIIE